MSEIKKFQEEVLGSIATMQEESKKAAELAGTNSAELKQLHAKATEDIETRFKALEGAVAKRKESEFKRNVDAKFEHEFKNFNATLKMAGRKELSIDEAKKSNEAYASYVRFGPTCGGNEEHKSLLNNIIGSEGQFIAPPEYSSSIIERKFDEHGILDMVKKITIGGAQWVQNVDDADYSDSEYLNSLANETTEHTPDFKQVTATPNEHIYKFPISRSLREDAVFDIVGHVLRLGQEGSIRKSAAQVVLGNGQNRPKGILTYVDSAVNQAESFDSISAIQSNAATIKWEDLITDLPKELGDGYYGNASYAMNRRTFFDLLKDTDGANQFKIMNQINFFSGAGSSMAIMGKPVRFDAAMPTVATGANAVLFGDFEGYEFIERTGFSVIIDDVTDGMNTTYRLRRRNDGKLCQGRGFKALKMQ